MNGGRWRFVSFLFTTTRVILLYLVRRLARSYLSFIHFLYSSTSPESFPCAPPFSRNRLDNTPGTMGKTGVSAVASRTRPQCRRGKYPVSSLSRPVRLYRIDSSSSLQRLLCIHQQFQKLVQCIIHSVFVRWKGTLTTQ